MSRLRSYAQLVRLPNVFTALADICLGTFCALRARSTETEAGFADELLSHLAVFAIVLLASACFYCGGMVWNDYFDREEDRRDRPFRPIPSGKIKPGAAVRLGAGLLVAGLLCTLLAGWSGSGWRKAPFVVGVLLASAVLLYDSWLKHTWAGPLGMGLCRLLNVLLGLTVVELPLEPWGFHLAFVVGIYIAGVTWFARTEARQSNQNALKGAAGVMLASLLLALALPVRDLRHFPPGSSSPLFPYLLVVLGFYVGLAVVQAILEPTPKLVQAAVKRSLMGLVLLDAVTATALVGEVGLVILILMPPALYLGRWIYST